MSEVLGRLRWGLIVSVQAYPDSVLNTPETIALLARCAVANGAVCVRIEGPERIAAVRAAVGVPIVGLLKRAHAGFEPYITSTLEDVAEIARAGADIVAFDATDRPRAGAATSRDLIAAARAHGCLAMADCAELADIEQAVADGADIAATTLAGYTARTQGRTLPDLDLLASAALRHPFTACEGGIAAPEQAAAAFAAGASAVVVGTAITNVDALVRRFAAVVPGAPAFRARMTT